MSEWFSDDSFWNDLYDHIFTSEKEDIACEQVGQVLKLTGVEKGRALDMPCGPGRHAAVLAQSGFDVTAVDLNSRLLDRVKSRAKESGIEIELVRQDMRSFVRPESYDLAISMFNSLGYFESAEEDVRIIANYHKSLRHGGAVLFELVCRDYLSRNFEPVKISEAPNGSVMEQRIDLLDGGGKIRNEWRLKYNGMERDFHFEQTVFSGEEINEMMLCAGFEKIELYGNLEGAPYDENATRLIAIGRK
ncbi:MAG: methyltransferase domain-containing protein [Planctomycetes bacterium]|nr:methyltransferase domain-containing protein [Planctomycetota bacterium]